MAWLFGWGKDEHEYTALEEHASPLPGITDDIYVAACGKNWVSKGELLKKSPYANRNTRIAVLCCCTFAKRDRGRKHL